MKYKPYASLDVARIESRMVVNWRLLAKWMQEHNKTLTWLRGELEIDAATLWRRRQGGRVTRAFVLAVAQVTGLPVEELEVPTKFSSPKRPHVCRCYKCGPLSRVKTA